MLYKRTGMPIEGEILLCTVTKIYHHSVFVNLDEFGNLSGMIHISEIAPGRIRNIRDYVIEGKKIFCKVLKIHEDKGHIDLSLRRVSDSQKRAKNEFIQQEQKSEKIIEFVSKEAKKDVKEVYSKIASVIFPEYESLHDVFFGYVTEEFDINKFGFDKDFTSKLSETIKQRVKPPEVELSGDLSIISYAPDGVDVVKKSLMEAEKEGKDSADIRYLGAGKFKITVKSSDYKDADKILESVVESATAYAKKHSAEANFVKAKVKH